MKEDFPYGKSYCRQCGNEITRDYKRRNKEKISQYNKQYKEKHKEEISEYNHNYNLENREQIQQRQTENQRKRRDNENIKLSKRLRNYLTKILKKKCKVKCDRLIVERYGCNNIFFKQWIESQFNENMNWENYGKYWHIDHINPCCMFDLTKDKDQKESFHWSNLRPLEIIDNQKKTNKLDETLFSAIKHNNMRNSENKVKSN
jgi:hypothetical protein